MRWLDNIDSAARLHFVRPCVLVVGKECGWPCGGHAAGLAALFVNALVGGWLQLVFHTTSRTATPNSTRSPRQTARQPTPTPHHTTSSARVEGTLRLSPATLLADSTQVAPFIAWSGRVGPCSSLLPPSGVTSSDSWTRGILALSSISHSTKPACRPSFLFCPVVIRCSGTTKSLGQGQEAPAAAVPSTPHINNVTETPSTRQPACRSHTETRAKHAFCRLRDEQRTVDALCAGRGFNGSLLIGHLPQNLLCGVSRPPIPDAMMDNGGGRV